MRVRTVTGLLGFLLISAAGGLGPEPAECQEMAVPIEVQASLFSRVVQFDRTFDARSEDGLVVGVLFEEESPLSVAAKNQFSTALSASGLLDSMGRPAQVVGLQPGEELGSALEAASVDFLYVVAPIPGIEIERISAETHRLGVVSHSGVPAYVRGGLAVGFGIQEGRPRILINLSAAEAEGADYQPGLLKLAEIVGRIP